MPYTVNGITFTEDELTTVAMSDLRSGALSPAHLLMFIKDRPFLLLRAGDLVDDLFLEKYSSQGVESFKALVIAPEKDVNDFKFAIRKFFKMAPEVEKLAARDEFTKLFGDRYWKKSRSGLLEFTKACFDELYALPMETFENVQETSYLLSSRALFSGSIAVASAIFENITDYNFLKDIYNAAFMMDFGLTQAENFNYYLMQACERERLSPGTGLIFLEEKNRPKAEKDIFFNHPRLGRDLCKEYEKEFTYPEVIDHIRFHHEKSDGSGFPSGHSYSGISRTETILSFADYMAPFREIIFTKSDGNELFESAFNGVKELERSQPTLLEPCLQSWESARKWALSAEVISDKESEVA